MLGGLAGVFSVSQEGVMLLGASVGFLISYSTGSNAVGILVAAVVGGLFGLMLGWSTTVLRLDQFVIGLALFFAATGLAGLLFRVVIGQTGQTPLVDTLPRLEIPLLSEIPRAGHGAVLAQRARLRRRGARRRAVLLPVPHPRRTGPALGGREPEGRRQPRHPGRVDPALDQHRRRRADGDRRAYLPMVYTGTFTEGIVGGRGWLAIALTFFGGWRPQFIVAGRCSSPPWT